MEYRTQALEAADYPEKLYSLSLANSKCVSSLCVAKKFRRTGIATKIMKFCIQENEKNNLHTFIDMWIGHLKPEFGNSLLRYYESLGFKLEIRRPILNPSEITNTAFSSETDVMRCRILGPFDFIIMKKEKKIMNILEFNKDFKR